MRSVVFKSRIALSAMKGKRTRKCGNSAPKQATSRALISPFLRASKLAGFLLKNEKMFVVLQRRHFFFFSSVSLVGDVIFGIVV